jgi:hypothetical protein
MSTTPFFRLLAALALACAIPACCMRHCVPEHLAGQRALVDLCADPGGHQTVGFEVAKEVAAEFRRRSGAMHPPGTPPYHFLALSSGGLNGAFGVGVLKGWSDSGTRPPFDVVTGISAGALMSTFAFLGPQYDDQLSEIIVGVRRRDFLRRRSIFGVIPGSSLYANRRMARKIEEVITPRILCEVAAAHREGRRLYVATTNLDTESLKIWDMGAIACRNTPASAALYRQIILASSSVPLAFPPVKFHIDIDSVPYDELHVDGAVCDGVIFRSWMVGDLNRLRGVPGAMAPFGSTLHVINNGKLFPQPGCVKGFFQIIAASANSILYHKSRDELHRIYLTCLMTGVEFFSTEVPRDLDITSSSLNLSKEEQRLLFETGRRFGPRAMTGGEGWRDTPPGSNPRLQGLPRAGTHFASGGDGAKPAPAGGTGSCPACVPRPARVEAIPAPQPPAH